MNDTVFSKIIRKEIPSVSVFEDDWTYAFLDKTPVNKGHVLVIPKKASNGLLDADPEVLKHVITTVQKVAAALKKSLGADGINTLQNEGAAAGQKVFHLHYHVIPRFEGDGYEHWHGQTYASDAEAEQVASQIRSAF